MNDYIYEFKDLPSTDTPYYAETFNAMQNKLLDSIYPIGRGFIDFTDTDFSNYLGFTWERELVGLTPVGLDATQTEFNTIGKKGGEKTHTLTVSEMPSHKHQIYVNRDTGVTGPGSYYPATQVTTPSNYVDNNICEYAGGNQPHNILQPYQVVAYWKRVA